MRRPWLTLLCSACIDGPGLMPVRLVGDYDTYVAEIQPVLAAGCSNPSCHGQAGRPLEIYAPQRHRADPDREFLDEPLDDDELRLNWLRACSFLVPGDPPESCLLVRKPLGVEQGGVEHVGGVQLQDTEDPNYLVLLQWIAEARPTDEGGAQ